MFLGFKHPSAGTAWSNSAEDIIAFFKKILLNLKSKIPETMDDFILRLDMFEVDGKLKLNEVESFDAQYLAKSERQGKKGMGAFKAIGWSTEKTHTWLGDFWYNKLLELISLYKMRFGARAKEYGSSSKRKRSVDTI